MRFTIEYPIGQHGYDTSFLTPAALLAVARTLDERGFDAIAFTEHPAPSRKWLESGGHESFDPLSSLAFAAAVTTRLRLMTYLLVLPYRNPLLVAKQISTVDVLSGGRLTVAAGSGYLRSEFGALGVDFEERNALFDEALEVLTNVWKGEEFVFEGAHFHARGQVLAPPPVQLPHPPIWIGGNSRAARRRVAKFGQGWSPLLTDEQLSNTTRTAQIDSIDALADAITDLHALLTEAGRDPATVDVQVQASVSDLLSLEQPAESSLDTLAQLAKAGVTSVAIQPPSGSVAQCLEALEQYSAEVLPFARDL